MEYKLTEKELNSIIQYLLSRPGLETFELLLMIDTLTKEQNENSKE